MMEHKEFKHLEQEFNDANTNPNDPRLPLN